METINRNAQLQTPLISGILDVSRISTSKLCLNLQPVNLPSMIQAAVDTIRPASEGKGLRLETQLSP